MKVKLPAEVAGRCRNRPVQFLATFTFPPSHGLNVSLPGLEREVAQAIVGRHARRDMRIFQRYTGQHRRYAQPRVSRLVADRFTNDPRRLLRAVIAARA